MDPKKEYSERLRTKASLLDLDDPLGAALDDATGSLEWGKNSFDWTEGGCRCPRLVSWVYEPY